MPVSDLDQDLKLLRDAALEAGRIAMRYFCKSLKTWDKEPNHPVTEADIAVNDYLEATLCGARPDYGWLSEETADTPDRLNKKRVFVVDPIDGTRAFMRGEPHFCICLTVLEDSEPVVGVIYAPVHKEMYEAVKGKGTFLNGDKVRVSTQSTVENARMISDRNVFEHPAWPEPWPDMILPELKPNATAYRMALVAAGKWDCVLVLTRKSDWDLAAASLLIEEAGGIVACHDGTPFVFNRKAAAQKSLIAAGMLLHEHLIVRCKHIDLPEPGD